MGVRVLRSLPSQSMAKLADRLLKLGAEVQPRPVPVIFEGSNIILLPPAQKRRDGEAPNSFSALITLEIMKKRTLSTIFTLCTAIGVAGGAYACLHKKADLALEACLFSGGAAALLWREQSKKNGYKTLLAYTEAAALTAENLGENPVTAQKHIMQAVVNAHTERLRL